MIISIDIVDMNFQMLAVIMFGSLSLLTLVISGLKALDSELDETLEDENNEGRLAEIVIKKNLKFKRFKLGDYLFLSNILSLNKKVVKAKTKKYSKEEKPEKVYS